MRAAIWNHGRAWRKRKMENILRRWGDRATQRLSRFNLIADGDLDRHLLWPQYLAYSTVRQSLHEVAEGLSRSYFEA
jgi:hypothetical protein